MDSYEISLWEDDLQEAKSPKSTRVIEVDPLAQPMDLSSYYKERKICIIGSDTLTDQSRAVEPKLVENINGTKTFTFKIYKTYIDNITGQLVTNPFLPYLVNERKVKVKWKKQWYDFVIKKIVENNTDKSITYTCIDLFIHELSKNGYELNFDPELKNSTGGAEELIKEVLRGTNWQYDTYSDPMVQTKEGALIRGQVINQFDAKNEMTSGTESILASNYILIFYDLINQIFTLEPGQSFQVSKLQFLIDSDNLEFEYNSNLIINTPVYSVKNVTITHNIAEDRGASPNGNGYSFIVNNEEIAYISEYNLYVLTDMRGEYFVNTDTMVYDPLLGKYVTHCLDSLNHSVYRTEITEEAIGPANLFANPRSYKNTGGWSSTSNDVTIPSVKCFPDDYIIDDSYDYLNFSGRFLKAKGLMYNNGLNIGNEAVAQIKSFKEGDKYTFRYRALKNRVIPKQENEVPGNNSNFMIKRRYRDGESISWKDCPIYIYKGQTTGYKRYGEFTTLDVGRLVKFGCDEIDSTLPENWFKFDTVYQLDNGNYFKIQRTYLNSYDTTFAIQSGTSSNNLTTKLSFGLHETSWGYSGFYFCFESNLNSHNFETCYLRLEKITGTYNNVSNYADQVFQERYGYAFPYPWADAPQEDRDNLTAIRQQLYLSGYEDTPITEKTGLIKTAYQLNNGEVNTNSTISAAINVEQIFGSPKHTRAHDFMGELVYRETSSILINDSIEEINFRTFTPKEIDWFYTKDVNEYYRKKNGVNWDHPNNRGYLLIDEAVTLTQDWVTSTYGPDVITYSDFYFYEYRPFTKLYNNLAEKIWLDSSSLPCYNNSDVKKFKAIKTLQNRINSKNSTLQNTSGVYEVWDYNEDSVNSEYVNKTDYSTNEYVIYRKRPRYGAYNENNWVNYSANNRNYQADLYKKKNNEEAVFSASDSDHWTKVTSGYGPYSSDKTLFFLRGTDLGLSYDIKPYDVRRSIDSTPSIGFVTEDVIYQEAVNRYIQQTNEVPDPSSSYLAELRNQIRQEWIDGTPMRQITLLKDLGLEDYFTLEIISDPELEYPSYDFIREVEAGLNFDFEYIANTYGMDSVEYQQALAEQQRYIELAKQIWVYKYKYSDNYNSLWKNTFKPLQKILPTKLEGLFNGYNYTEEEEQQYIVDVDNTYIDYFYPSDYDSNFPNITNSGLNYITYSEENTYYNNNNNHPKIEFLLLPSGSSNTAQNCFDIVAGPDGPARDGNNNWVEYQLICNRNVQDISEWVLAIKINGNNTVWFQDVQFFKNNYYEYNGSQYLAYPGTYPQLNKTTQYAYYYPSDNNIDYIYIGDLNPNYTPISGPYKQATIKIKQSNRFNILQTIGESFKGWIYFNIIHEDDGSIAMQYGVPQKYVGIKQYLGEYTNIPFEYGIDLKSITRTIDSNKLSTKVIVPQNSNEFAKNGFCTISRCNQNPAKANFVLNFDYYIQMGLINEDDLNYDLYEYYYPALSVEYTNYDQANSILLEKESQLLKYEAEYTIKSTQRSAQIDIASEKAAIYSKLTGIQPTSTNSNYNKAALSQWNSWYQASIEYSELSEQVQELSEKIATLKTEITAQRDLMEDALETIEYYNAWFNQKYWPFIFEGTWQDESYIDDTQYYIDALSVAYNSSRPQLSYNINVLRLTSLDEFSAKKFHVGDICYIIDREFFGFDSNGNPNKEKVMIEEITSYFDSPEKDVISVKNYRTSFDSLFQKVVATSQALKFSEGMYTRVAGAITPEKTIEYDLLQNTFAKNQDLVMKTANQSVVWDEGGITITDSENSANKTRIIAGGLFTTSDGGQTWKNAVRGDGISADLLTAGRINSGEIAIYDDSYPMFMWNKNGISAYSYIKKQSGNVDYFSANFNKFVRFDKYGIYGYDNPSADGSEDFQPESENEIWANDYTKFGLTWKGFFLKSGTDNGYVKISTDGDLIKNEDGEIIDRKIIQSGRDGEDTFYLTQGGDAFFSGELNAASGTFRGSSTNSYLTLGDNGLILRVKSGSEYIDVLRTGYLDLDGNIYPYLELCGGKFSSIILQKPDGSLYVGPKYFLGRTFTRYSLNIPELRTYEHETMSSTLIP